VFHVHADPASVFKDAASDPFACGVDDHFQSALLTRPPDVRRFTA
jgi:hypothetical protein